MMRLLRRCNLASVALQLIAMGISDVLSFDFMDKPSPDVRCIYRYRLFLVYSEYKHEILVIIITL